MQRPTGQLRHGDRLRRSAEFVRVSREGRRAAGAEFVLLVAGGPRGDEVSRQRLGITVSRKVGGAVVRNRVKRQVREWFRSARLELRPGIDLVVIGRSAAARLASREVKGVLCSLAHKVGATRARDPRALASSAVESPSCWYASIRSPCLRGWDPPVGSSRAARGTRSRRSSATVSCAVAAWRSTGSVDVIPWGDLATTPFPEGPG